MTRTVIVLAKAPVAGRVKTRLCPPCEPDQAAQLAEAALADTLDAVLGVRDVHAVLALDGRSGNWLRAGIDVVEQRGRGLDERLAFAFDDVGSGALLIGMDTPQVTTGLLECALEKLERADAALGPCWDGGWWAIGLNAPRRAAFLGVPMSTRSTHAAQLARLNRLGLLTAPLPCLRDVDYFDDAVAVASRLRNTRFEAVMKEVVGSIGDRCTTVGAGR